MHERIAGVLKDAGIPVSGSYGAGSQNSGQDSGTSEAVRQATQQIQELQTVTQTNVDSLTANTGAIADNTESHTTTASSVAGSVGQAASGILGGGGLLSGGGLLGGGGLSGILSGGLLGGLASLFSGLFGGGSSQPAPLTTYQAPPSQSFALAESGGTLTDEVPGANGMPKAASVTELALGSVTAPQSSGAGSGSGSSGGGSQSQQPMNVTVQVQAMDSRLFLDHSNDIAQAVKEAMLNMHSINDVVNDL